MKDKEREYRQKQVQPMKKRSVILLVVLSLILGAALHGILNPGAKDGDPVRASTATEPALAAETAMLAETHAFATALPPKTDPTVAWVTATTPPSSTDPTAALVTATALPLTAIPTGAQAFSSSQPTAEAHAALSPGDQGDDVRRLQERLNELGYSVGKADGDYGAKTESGVKKLQKAAGLAVTGIADSGTQAVLWAMRAPTAAPTAKPTPTAKPIPTAQPTPTAHPTPVATETPAEAEYILNRNTGVFHYPWCSSVDQMKESNKIYFTGDRQEAIDDGYRPCKRCEP